MSTEIMKQAFNALREMHYALGRAHDTMRRPTKYVKAALLQGQSAITALRPVIAKEWAGLTEDDLASCKSDEFVVFAKTIEAKLKEKNNGN